MKKDILLGALALIILVGATVFYTQKQSAVLHVVEPVQQPVVFDGKNSTFTIDEKAVTLVDGLAVTPAAPGAASQVTTRYFGNASTGDLNRDGVEDIAYLVTQDGGGSGLFYYAVVALKTPTGYQTTNAFLIGDRIAPQTTQINAGTKELYVNFAERKPGEPMTARPSIGVTLRLTVSESGVLMRSPQ
jgi:hypothetical protein